jgi:Tol biopolymer transport system component
VPGDTWQTYDIYVRDISDPTPANHVTERVTVGLGDVRADGSSSTPLLSPDGRYVWFTSAATNLVPGDTNGRSDLFVHDRQIGTTSLVNVTAATGQPLNGDVYLADVSPDGRWVSFSSDASTILTTDTNGLLDAFLLDTTTSVVRRMSPPLSPQATAASFAGPVSDDGRYVVYTSNAANLVAGDTNGRQDVFVADRVNRRTQRISLGTDGGQRDGVSWTPVAASADASVVVYPFQGTGEGVFSLWRSDLVLP